MNSNAHAYIVLCFLFDLSLYEKVCIRAEVDIIILDNFDHLQSHFDTVLGMILVAVIIESSHTVVAIAQYLDTHAIIQLLNAMGC